MLWPLHLFYKLGFDELVHSMSSYIQRVGIRWVDWRCQGLNLQPSDSQPDAITIGPWWTQTLKKRLLDHTISFVQP